MIGRLGGEEFGIIVEGLSEEATVRVGEDIRAAIEKAAFRDNSGLDLEESITVSVGVCMASEAGGADDLYAKADQALYASKNGGRNRVTKFPVPGKQPSRKSWMIYRTD